MNGSADGGTAGRLGSAAKHSVIPRLPYVLIFVCCVLSVVAACLAAQLGYDCWQRGLLDIRSVVIPRWLLFFPLVLGFGLCAVEFLKIIPQSGRLKETDS